MSTKDKGKEPSVVDEDPKSPKDFATDGKGGSGINRVNRESLWSLSHVQTHQAVRAPTSGDSTPIHFGHRCHSSTANS